MRSIEGAPQMSYVFDANGRLVLMSLVEAGVRTTVDSRGTAEAAYDRLIGEGWLVVFSLPPKVDAAGKPLDVRLIDLPGYGYAKVPEELREHWKAEIDLYLHQRESLRGLILIVDIRHPLKDFDRMMLGFCAGTRLPCHVLLTKADKVSRGQAGSALQALRNEFNREGWHNATAQIFSSSEKTGVDEARARVQQLLVSPRD